MKVVIDMKKKMPIDENLIYYAYCILTLGFVWLCKIVIKKAIIEANEK